MLIADDGQLPLPWLALPLAEVLTRQRGHALMVQGAAGVGVLPFGVSLAQSWLCEAPVGPGLACGRCGSCRLVQGHVHPDLFLLMPELQRRERSWLLASDKPEADSGKKPSRQIRVDEVRQLIDWAYKTSARGRGKVAVLTPGETLNLSAANALLKTLEEPPAGTRLIVTTPDPARLLPTVRSRCQAWRLAEPDGDVATAWLAGQGVDEPQVLLAACAGRPLDALELHQRGVRAEQWRQLPQAIARGQGAAVQGWPLPQLLDLLLKLCHDALAVAGGAAPRYFVAGSVPKAASIEALRQWSHELQRVARHAAHPWNEGVLVDSLVAAASRALRSAPARPAAAGPRRPGFDTLPA